MLAFVHELLQTRIEGSVMVPVPLRQPFRHPQDDEVLARGARDGVIAHEAHVGGEILDLRTYGGHPCVVHEHRAARVDESGREHDVCERRLEAMVTVDEHRVKALAGLHEQGQIELRARLDEAQQVRGLCAREEPRAGRPPVLRLVRIDGCVDRLHRQRVGAVLERRAQHVQPREPGGEARLQRSSCAQRAQNARHRLPLLASHPRRLDGKTLAAVETPAAPRFVCPARTVRCCDGAS